MLRFRRLGVADRLEAGEDAFCCNGCRSDAVNTRNKSQLLDTSVREKCPSLALQPAFWILDMCGRSGHPHQAQVLIMPHVDVIYIYITDNNIYIIY